MKKFILLGYFALVIFCNQMPTIAAEVDLTKDGYMQKYISNIGFKILNANRIEKRMVFYYKTDAKTMNAYASTLDRSVVMLRGLSVYLESDDEFAAVLSHEISHNVDSYDGILRGTFSNFSYALTPRKFETKADKRAVDYMVKAGYNPVALIVAYNKFMGQYRYEVFTTHPLTSRRIMYVYEYIYNKYPEYLVNNEYKNNVYYQNFLLTSRENREKLQKKIESSSTKKVNYL